MKTPMNPTECEAMMGTKVSPNELESRFKQYVIQSYINDLHGERFFLRCISGNVSNTVVSVSALIEEYREV